METGEKFALRAAARSLVDEAVQAGMEDAYLLTEMTPREIGQRFSAIAAQRQREAERMDMLAWLVGRYVLTAVHAPRRYPRRPDAVLKKSRAMSDSEMKRVFFALSEKRRETDGGN